MPNDNTEIVKRNAVGFLVLAKKRSSAKHKKKSEKGKDEEAWRDTEQ